jgi:quinol monooxygenase YgiN
MVTLINQLTVTGSVEEFERVTEELTAYMCRQPGYLGYRTLRSISKPNVFVEIAEWESAEAHRAAVTSEGFQSRVRQLAGLVAKPTPDLYETVREAAPSSVA